MIKSYRLSRLISDIVIYVILAVLGIIWVSPLVWLLLHSFRAEGGVTVPYVFPKQYTLANYKALFTDTSVFDYPRWFLNTFVVAVFSCIISTLSVLMVSYAFSRLRFKSRKMFINIGMILGMFPGFMTMMALYYLLKAMNLTQTLPALVICYSSGAGLGFAISKGFFDTIPRALDEAATIDGATRNQIFWKIILPMSKPIIVYTVLTSFIGPWCDFILVRIIMGDKRDNYTVAMGLQKMTNQEYKQEHFKKFLSGSVIVAIPITVLFLKMQNYYVEGVTAGGVKG
ncbi:MAG: sugar ABC transporter permease [Acutalibacteraceae bacterium]|nr:sugar ABC transporter permease [Clostridia bacterium]MEE3449496.1 sugar ABC transporter permease [Acutalibacteraceae bacterium]